MTFFDLPYRRQVPAGESVIDGLASPVIHQSFMDLLRWRNQICVAIINMSVELSYLKALRLALRQTPVLPASVVLLDCLVHQWDQTFHLLCCIVLCWVWWVSCKFMLLPFLARHLLKPMVVDLTSLTTNIINCNVIIYLSL